MIIWATWEDSESLEGSSGAKSQFSIDFGGKWRPFPVGNCPFDTALWLVGLFSQTKLAICHKPWELQQPSGGRGCSSWVPATPGLLRSSSCWWCGGTNYTCKLPRASLKHPFLHNYPPRGMLLPTKHSLTLRILRRESRVESSRCCEATTAFSLPNVQWNICCAQFSTAVTIGMEIKWLLPVYEEGQKSKESNVEAQPPATLTNNSFPNEDKPSPTVNASEVWRTWASKDEAHKNYFLMRKKIRARFSVHQLLTQTISGSICEIRAEAVNAFSAYLFQLIPPE